MSNNGLNDNSDEGSMRHQPQQHRRPAAAGGPDAPRDRDDSDGAHVIEDRPGIPPAPAGAALVAGVRQHLRAAPGSHSVNAVNQVNPPEWAAFPDLLRVQEGHQQNGAATAAAGGLENDDMGAIDDLDRRSLMQSARSAAERAPVNPPDVSRLPSFAAGTDPPPPDFDIGGVAGGGAGSLAQASGLRAGHQRLPDMALDADNAALQHHGASGNSSQHSLPDMALDASEAGVRQRAAAAVVVSCNNASSGQCGVGARFRPRRPPPVGNGTDRTPHLDHSTTGQLSSDNGLPPGRHHPGSLAQIAQQAAAPSSSVGFATARAGGASSGNLQGIRHDEGGGIATAGGGQAIPSAAGTLLHHRLFDLEAQISTLRLQIVERERQRAEETHRLMAELSSIRRIIEESSLRATRDHSSSLEERFATMESLLQKIAANAGLPDAAEAYRNLRLEERARRRREVERLSRVLAESLQAGITYFTQHFQDASDDDADSSANPPPRAHER